MLTITGQHIFRHLTSEGVQTYYTGLDDRGYACDSRYVIAVVAETISNLTESLLRYHRCIASVEATQITALKITNIISLANSFLTSTPYTLTTIETTKHFTMTEV